MGHVRGRARLGPTYGGRRSDRSGDRRRRIHRALDGPARRGKGHRLPCAGGPADRLRRLGPQCRPGQCRALAAAAGRAQQAWRGSRRGVHQGAWRGARLRAVTDRTPPNPLRSQLVGHDPCRPFAQRLRRPDAPHRGMETPGGAGRPAVARRSSGNDRHLSVPWRSGGPPGRHHQSHGLCPRPGSRCP